jgi:hypothetical protein
MNTHGSRWFASISLVVVLAQPDGGAGNRTVDGSPIVRLLSKDAIRSVDKPRMIPAESSRRLQDWERVLGVTDGQESRAYPLRILDAREIVNDRIGGRAIAATW